MTAVMLVVITVVVLAMFGLALIRSFKEAEATFDTLTDIRVEDWDTYSVSYDLPGNQHVTGLFAAGSADAVAATVLDLHPGAEITWLENVTRNSRAGGHR